jgi:TonB-linked SusC/RagA family outer membrane protein
MRALPVWTLVLMAGTASGQEAAPPPETAAAPAAEAAPAAPAAEATPAEAAAPAVKAGRTLRGRVVDASSGEGVPLAEVTVDTTPPMRVEADVDGNFVLDGLPADAAVTVRGFSADFLPKDLRSPAGQGTLTIKLDRAFTEDVVVVGRATGVSRVNAPNAVAQVKAEEIVATPVQTVDAALAGKVAGANIQSNSGAPGGGVQMRLRGISTINGQSSPLYVVDGVLISDASISNGLNAVTGSAAGNSGSTQDDATNRIADLNPNDIEDIQILKGASAAAIYGSKASNGVVIITTKRGKSGAGDQPQVDFAQRVGVYQLANKLGSRRFSREDAVATYGQETVDQYFQEGRTFDHESLLSSNAKPSTETSISVNGSLNGGKTTYFASGLLRDDEGVVTGTGYEKQGLRLNVGQKFGDRFDLKVTSNLIHSNAARGMFNNDNAGVSPFVVLSSTPSFFDMRPDADGNYPANPFVAVGTNPLQTLALMSNKEDVWRFVGSTDATLNILKENGHDLRLMGNLGVDRFQQKNELFFPPELHFEPADDQMPGTSLLTDGDNLNLNLGTNLVHSWDSNGGLIDNATTSLGFQYEERNLNTLYVTSRNQIAGQPNVDSGTSLSVNQTRQQMRDRGVYLSEEMLLLDRRLMLNAAVRGEQSSLNGASTAVYFYPKAAAAYRLTGLPSFLNELKLRAAYGEAGNLPLWGYKYTSLLASNTIGGFPGLLANTQAGNRNIRPERQQEFEAGVDVIGFNGDGVLELTVYQRNISDMLLSRSVAPSLGYQTEFFNGGAMYNRGVEVMLQATPVNVGGIKWDSRATFALNRSMVTDLPVPGYYTGGFGVNYGAYRIEQGKPLTAIYANVGLEEDGTTKIRAQVADAEPIFRMGFANTFAIGGLRVYGLLDWQQGSSIVNLTKMLYDAGGVTPDFATAGAARIANQSRDMRPYIEDASFLKLREVTVSYDLPAGLYRQLVPGVRTARLALSGRNLLTFTKYSGLDPEVSNFGNQAVNRNIDVAPYPPSRSFWGSIELGF